MFQAAGQVAGNFGKTYGFSFRLGSHRNDPPVIFSGG